MLKIPNKMTERISGHSLVVAIDIGTYHSGYALSLIGDNRENPMNIQASYFWNDGIFYPKTPTCLLLNSNKEFVSFGYEAKNRYANLVFHEKEDDYYYFPRFKTSLHSNTNVNSHMTIKDINGKTVLAVDVFALSIKSLVNHLKDRSHGPRMNVPQNEIQWVLTVPAVWTYNSNEFMIESAEKAGIQKSQLLLIKEPEAALIYCHYFSRETLGGAEYGLEIPNAGTKYMVVDLGATVDITVYETTVGCNIKELGRTIRADCGGIAVENGFMQFFANILGKPRLDLLKQEDMSDYLDFIREIESVKQLFTTRTPRKGKITINMPWYTFCSLRETNSLKDFSTVLESTYASSVSIRHNKIIIDEELFEDIFENAIQSILELLHNMFERLEFRTVTSICLVGGFSKCELVRSAIRKAFPTKRILMPDDATLNGAVLYGHQSEWYTWYEDKSYDFVPIDEDIIDNFDYTPRSPPPLFTEYSKGYATSQGINMISRTARKTCETVLIGFEMATTDYILMHGGIDMDCYSHTVNAAKMIQDIERNRPFWMNKSTLEAFRLNQVKGLLESIKEKNYIKILKIYYRLQHQHTLNADSKPLEIPVYLHRCQLTKTWLRAVKNAITTINEVTPGIHLHETEDINLSKIHIGVHKSHDPSVACTMHGTIMGLPTNAKPFIHLGCKWNVNQMKGTSIHELMHALGFHHEMQRLDRKLYLHVDKNADHNYDLKAYTILTRFDPFSVMLYPEDDDMWRKGDDPIWNLKKTQDQCQELSELDKVALNLKYKPCINNYINYVPQLSKHTGMLYCGRQVMLNHNQVGKATTDGFCGPDNWANCASCRVILRIKDKDNQSKDISKLEDCLQKGKWQGLSGLFYCGNKDEKFADLKHVESDGICGPDTGIPCTECGNELYNGYSIESCDSYFIIEQKRRCVLQ